MANNSYIVEYAASAKGSCKFSGCDDKKMAKGELRIGKTFPSDRFQDGGAGKEFYHPKCWFEAQKRTKKTTKKIEEEDDIEGFDTIKSSDQALIRELIKHRNDPPLTPKKKKAKNTGGGDGGGTSPKKASKKQVYVDDDEAYADDDYAQSKATSSSNNSNNSNKNKNNNNGKNISKNLFANKSSDSEEEDRDRDSDAHDDDGNESDLEKDTWGAVASNGSRVAKILNSTALSQVSVLILGSASKKAIQRVAAQEPRAFDDEFGSDYDAWIQWLGGLGVLWISTDFEDAGFANPGLWEASLTLILKQLFQARTKKALVVALWGPDAKNFKKAAKQYYEDTMGSVKYRVVDGATPLNASFNSQDELAKIDKARSDLGLPAIHWWPFEGEVKNSNNGLEKKASSGVGDGLVKWVLDCKDEGIVVELTGGPSDLGRSLVHNKKISRKQCVVDTRDDGVVLTPCGVNPMTLSRLGKPDDVEILSKDEPTTLREGDSFTLCGEQYRFVVRKPTVQKPPQKPTPKKVKPLPKSDDDQEPKESDVDKTKDLSEPQEVEMEDKAENDDNKGHESGGEAQPKAVVAGKNSTFVMKKKSPPSSVENESATVPFSAGYDSDEAKAKKASDEAKTKKAVAVKQEKTPSQEDDDEALARKLQEEEEANTPKPSGTKSKNNTPDKDEMLARKLQDEFNKQAKGGGGGGGGSNSNKKKRKQEDDDDDDDGEVNWASKVKKQKKNKKGSDDDDDWDAAAPLSDSDEDYEEENSDEDNKSSKKGKGGGGGSSKKKPKCKYGAACYRQNVQHREEFSHPK